MEMKQVANYLNGRFLITNIKKDKTALLKGHLLASCSVDSLGTSKQEVQYYDTPDMFFASKGINIYTVLYPRNKELIISFDSEHVSRINFLRNTPNFFKVVLSSKNAGISGHYEQINDAIYQVLPEGLHVNIDDMLRCSSPRITIKKKCDSYRVVNNNGLKTSITFSNSTFIDLKTKHKESYDYLEIVAEASVSTEMFTGFLRSIIIDCPQLIKEESNELTVALKNLKN